MTDEIDRLATLPAGGVAEFFRDSDVLEITALIRDASDEQLRRLIEIDHFRAEGVRAILDRSGIPYLSGMRTALAASSE